MHLPPLRSVYMHVLVTAYYHLCCHIFCAVPLHPSHLFNMRHSPQTHGILLSYELWVSVTQHCAWLVSFFLTSTPSSTLQSSSMLRQPLGLDFICRLKKEKKKGTFRNSRLELLTNILIKDACISEWSLMSRMWAPHMIRSCYIEAWRRFRLAYNYRDQKKALCSLSL